jgi:ribosomal-protein-alanine N-acetyltransferase
LDYSAERVETGDRPRFEVAPVSHFWLTRLVAIDSTWNPRHWSLRLFEQELSNQFAVVKGLFAGSELVGYLIAHITFEEAHIVSLGLDPRWRRLGGGRYLLKEFIRSARLEGVSVFTLDVRVSNEGAQRLYHSFGFAVSGVRKGYYSSNGEDAVSMRYQTEGAGGHHKR